MARRVNDFKCGDCGERVDDILYNNVNDGDSTSVIFTPEFSNIVCPKCNSTNMIKLIGATHHSSDGGKGIGARTPDGFKDVLKAIKKGTPEKYRGDRFNSV